MSKHLTLSDRAIIEKYLAPDMSFAYIARRLNRSATTISREVKNHRCFVYGVRYTSNDCVHYRTCLRRNLYGRLLRLAGPSHLLLTYVILRNATE